MERYSDAQVWVESGCAPSAAVLAAARVRYIVRLVRTAPPILCALLQRSAMLAGSWLDQLKQDLSEVACVLHGTHGFCSLPPLNRPSHLSRFLHDSPGCVLAPAMYTSVTAPASILASQEASIPFRLFARTPSGVKMVRWIFSSGMRSWGIGIDDTAI